MTPREVKIGCFKQLSGLFLTEELNEADYDVLFKMDEIVLTHEQIAAWDLEYEKLIDKIGSLIKTEFDWITNISIAETLSHLILDAEDNGNLKYN
jgi:hypothetical protein